MTRRFIHSVAAFALLVVALLGISACGGPAAAPEQQVRQWLADAEDAAEAKERRRLISMISPAYADARGNDRDQVEDVLRVYFLRQNNVTLITAIEKLQVFGGTAAQVEMTVGMAGSNDGVLGFSADAYRFRLELEKLDKDWQLISARWGELGDELR